jgi:hypothetical protein
VIGCMLLYEIVVVLHYVLFNCLIGLVYLFIVLCFWTVHWHRPSSFSMSFVPGVLNVLACSGVLPSVTHSSSRPHWGLQR